MKAWQELLINRICSEKRKVFSRYDLSILFQDYEINLDIPKSWSTNRLISFLVQEGCLNEIILSREGKTSTGAKKRFRCGNVSPYSIGISLRKESYLSHSSAIFLHALTDQNPKTIYVNKEQTPKPRPRGGLSQPAINRAFSNIPRTSKYAFLTSDYRYVLLSGKQTNRLGVQTIEIQPDEYIDVTNLERTLIDIVVRPAYSGGVIKILEAYKMAKDKVSVGRLIKILIELDYVYPYHQSIGFLMDRAGFPENDLKEIQNLGMKWDFYLDYKISEPLFDDRWRLFYPQGI
jgi:hypothetical protein